MQPALSARKRLRANRKSHPGQSFLCPCVDRVPALGLIPGWNIWEYHFTVVLISSYCSLPRLRLKRVKLISLSQDYPGCTLICCVSFQIKILPECKRFSCSLLWWWWYSRVGVGNYRWVILIEWKLLLLVSQDRTVPLNLSAMFKWTSVDDDDMMMIDFM